MGHPVYKIILYFTIKMWESEREREEKNKGMKYKIILQKAIWFTKLLVLIFVHYKELF